MMREYNMRIKVKKKKSGEIQYSQLKIVQFCYSIRTILLELNNLYKDGKYTLENKLCLRLLSRRKQTQPFFTTIVTLGSYTRFALKILIG